jgi:hypothetical protein
MLATSEILKRGRSGRSVYERACFPVFIVEAIKITTRLFLLEREEAIDLNRASGLQ